jgi:hypothetical protein
MATGSFRQQCGGGEQQRERGHVVVPAPRLRLSECRGGQHQRHGEDGGRTEPVRPAHAPAREQGEREPTHVQIGRERVVAHERDPDRVEQLVVEREERERRVVQQEVEARYAVLLHEARRDRPVVAERVAAVHAALERVDQPRRPLAHHRRRAGRGESEPAEAGRGGHPPGLDARRPWHDPRDERPAEDGRQDEWKRPEKADRPDEMGD